MKSLFVGLLLGLFAVCSLAQLPAPPVSITLSWEAPIARADGTPLQVEELAGYVLDNSCASEPVIITGGDQLSHTLPIIIPFDCVFSVVAVDKNGVFSTPTEKIRVNFNAPNPPIFNAVQIN